MCRFRHSQRISLYLPDDVEGIKPSESAQQEEAASEEPKADQENAWTHWNLPPPPPCYSPLGLHCSLPPAPPWPFRPSSSRGFLHLTPPLLLSLCGRTCKKKSRKVSVKQCGLNILRVSWCCYGEFSSTVRPDSFWTFLSHCIRVWFRLPCSSLLLSVTRCAMFR